MLGEDKIGVLTRVNISGTLKGGPVYLPKSVGPQREREQMTEENKPAPKLRWQTIAKRWGVQVRSGGIDLGFTVACYVDGTSEGGDPTRSHVNGSKVSIRQWAKESGCGVSTISYYLKAWNLFADMQGFEDPSSSEYLNPDSEMPKELEALQTDDEEGYADDLRQEWRDCMKKARQPKEQEPEEDSDEDEESESEKAPAKSDQQQNQAPKSNPAGTGTGGKETIHESRIGEYKASTADFMAFADNLPASEIGEKGQLQIAEWINDLLVLIDTLRTKIMTAGKHEDEVTEDELYGKSPEPEETQQDSDVADWELTGSDVEDADRFEDDGGLATG
jgi:hypothetical protein